MAQYLFKKIILFIYFQLHWIFVAVHRPSPVVEAGASLCCSAQASHCSGFSRCAGSRHASSVAVAFGLQGMQALGQAGSSTCAHKLSSCGHGPQSTQASVVAEAGSVVVASRLQHTGSVAVVHWLSCFAACEIFLDERLKPCLPCWQADYYPLCHQRTLAEYLIYKM